MCNERLVVAPAPIVVRNIVDNERAYIAKMNWSTISSNKALLLVYLKGHWREMVMSTLKSWVYCATAFSVCTGVSFHHGRECNNLQLSDLGRNNYRVNLLVSRISAFVILAQSATVRPWTRQYLQ